MSESIIIQIPKPCHENWEEMKPDACGRFCASCQKTVVDFRSMTDVEIAKIIRSAGSGACGRFNESQLNRSIIISEEMSSKLFSFAVSKVAASFLLLQSFITNSFGQKQFVPAVEQTAQIKRENGGKLILKGSILDFNTKKPLVGMEISVSGVGYVKYSDADGHFQFILPDSFREKNMVIRAAYHASSSAETAGTIIREAYVTFNETGQQKEVALYRYPFSELDPVIVEIPYGPPISGGLSYIYVTDTVVRKDKQRFFQRIRNVFKKKP